MKKLNRYLLLAMCSALPLSSFADGTGDDPCNFVGKGDTFTQPQVMQCYNKVPFDQTRLQNIVDSIMIFRRASDLRGIYQQRYDWLGALKELRNEEFANDFAMQNALKAEHKRNKNQHIRYSPPVCYTGMFAAFIPLEFDSMIVKNNKDKDKGKQIIFVDNNPFWPDVYQKATGIDTAKLNGLKLVSIDGVPAMEFFRQFANDKASFDDHDGNNFMSVLHEHSYSIRISGDADFLPEKASSTYVFEDKSGKQITIDLPWIFASQSSLGVNGAVNLTSSTADFEALCYPNPFAADSASAGGAASASAGITHFMAGKNDKLNRHDRDLIEKQKLIKGQQKVHPKSEGRDYSEVSPGQLNSSSKNLSEVKLSDDAVAAAQGAAQVFQYNYKQNEKATIIRLADMAHDYHQAVAEGIAYANANSTKLILDLRDNGGGAASIDTWLMYHLVPAQATAQNANLSGRVLVDNGGLGNFYPDAYKDFDPTLLTTFYQLFANSATLAPIYAQNFGLSADQCMTVGLATVYPSLIPLVGVFAPQCFNSPATGQSFNNFAQLFGKDVVVTEQRGDFKEQLSALSYISPLNAEQFGWFPVADVNDGETVLDSRFTKENLIVLTDGANCSAGYFLPELLRNYATIVTAGGYVGEEMPQGTCRGGVSLSAANSDAILNAQNSQLQPSDAPIDPNKLSLLSLTFYGVDSNMEAFGIYNPNSNNLYVNSPSLPDYRLYIWTDTSDTNGWVYQRVLDAVEQQHGDDGNHH